jgi:2-phosphosulfolactate phosphatase
MKIDILDMTANISSLKGLVVVIDVLRAFTTACFVLNNGAKKIYPVADLEEARLLRKKHPNWILMGERKGLKLPDFDYGNSPAEIEHENLHGKTVVMTTSSGTQAIEKLVHADEIITGAFVNADAIVQYIKNSSHKEVHFLCTDNRWNDNEDFKLASYIIDRLSGLEISFENIKKHLIGHPTSDGFLRTPLTDNAVKDFHLSIELNTFNFIIRVSKTSKDLYLKKIEL